MQGKCYGSKSEVEDSGLSSPGTAPLSRLRGLADAAGAQTGVAQKRGPLRQPFDALQSVRQNAGLSRDSSVRQAAPGAPFLMTDPSDLVARALEILDKDDEAWRERRALDRTRSVP